MSTENNTPTQPPLTDSDQTEMNKTDTIQPNDSEQPKDSEPNQATPADEPIVAENPTPPQIVVNLNIGENGITKLAEALTSSAVPSETTDTETPKESKTSTPPISESHEVSTTTQPTVETTAEPTNPAPIASLQHDLTKESMGHIAKQNTAIIKFGALLVIFLLTIICVILFINYKEKQELSEKVVNNPVAVLKNTNNNAKSDIVIPQAVAVSSEESEAVMPEI